MRVLIINTSERIGGAAIAANRLMEALRKGGVKVQMLVRDKQTDRLTVLAVKGKWSMGLRFLWERLCIYIANGFSRKNLFQVDIANTGTDVTKLPAFERADVVHLHWVNQGFLSLADIDRIMHSGKKVVITMHDQWYFTGICHYSAQCDKYQTLCQDCELMNGHLLGDLAKKVFLRKQHIYRDARLTFVGCSRWMASLAQNSLLTKGHQVLSIPNAIDTDVFCPHDKAEARKVFGLPIDKHLLLFGCQRITDERKGFRFLVEALTLIKRNHPALAEATEIAVVGGEAENIRHEVPFDIIPISYVSDPQKMVSLYNAVDVYVTPSLQDNLPNTIMEAMACGIPCVGFNVGGIPEMIDHKENGYVATYKDAQDFADGIVWTLTSDRQALSTHARQKVMTTYSEDIVAQKYLEVYDV
ncbi:MAG: glycosyltransferase family 4 protein [Bacteroidaceae bacterium]|nr:glycosyltransferase family 4 protein [Bacteroidaceae bacterium]